MTISKAMTKDLRKTDKMVRRVMAGATPPEDIHIEIREPLVEYVDTAMLFDYTWQEWAKFFGAIILFCFVAGLAYGVLVVGYRFIF
tara:strand:+ start:229 stop:486 length:258 start_codon:yes stop_codon:yes gene_type:complete